MLGSNPSADSGTKTEAGRSDGVRLRRSSGPRDWHQSAKSQGSGNSFPRHFESNESEDPFNSKLANSYDSKLHFMLNQDTAAAMPVRIGRQKPETAAALPLTKMGCSQLYRLSYSIFLIQKLPGHVRVRL
jgi:hypothetical protein